MQTVLNPEQEHHSLLQEWSKKYPQRESAETEFTLDGPSDWNQWALQEIKILFLLKEAHSGYHPSIAPKIDEMQNKFFKNIVRWKNLVQLTIRSSQGVPEFSDGKISPEDISDIAIVEVKKLDEGKSTSAYREIHGYARDDKHFLKRQIELLNPNVVFCGGTIDQYDIIYDEKCDPLSKVGNVECWRFNDRLVVDFHHPSCWESPEKLYSLLSSLLTGVKAKRKDGFHWMRREPG